MRDSDTDRRQFIKLLLSTPMAFTIGANLEPATSTKPIPNKTALTPEESLAKLILLFGPWSASEKEQAQNFTRRFLEAKNTVSPYLPMSSELVQSLASRFPGATMAIKEINLQILPPEERELLLKLVKQIYSLIEVRFIVSNEPARGVCQSDRMRYTRAPMSGKI